MIVEVRFPLRAFPVKCEKYSQTTSENGEKFLFCKIEAKKIRFCLLKNMYD